MSKENLAQNFGRALKELRMVAGLSQEELALESELDRTYISMLERGKKTPTILTLTKLAKPLNVSTLQLLLRTQQLQIGEKVNSKLSKKSIAKPLLYGTSISCGQPLGTPDNIVEKELSLDEFMIKNPKETFFIKASGESMLPAIWDGDLLVISRSQKPQNGSIILAQINNEFTIKRFFKTSKGIRLVPENPDFNEVLVHDKENFLLCGVIIGITRLF
jgi:DNA polymerase V